MSNRDLGKCPICGVVIKLHNIPRHLKNVHHIVNPEDESSVVSKTNELWWKKYRNSIRIGRNRADWRSKRKKLIPMLGLAIKGHECALDEILKIIELGSSPERKIISNKLKRRIKKATETVQSPKGGVGMRFSQTVGGKI